MYIYFLFAVADKKTIVLDVERHMEEAQELVSMNSDSSSDMNIQTSFLLGVRICMLLTVVNGTTSKLRV